jgi:uncharacterized membrane protein
MKTRELVAAAIFIALTAVVTRYTAIPIPATRGFFNLGEVAIYVAAIVYGPLVGLLAGGVGSALADIWAQAPYYAPFTLVIKGIEGFVVGRLAQSTAASRLRATLAGGVLMVAGYFLAQTFFARTLGIAPTSGTAMTAALSEIPFNIVQVAVGVIVALLVTARVPRAVTERSGR